MIRLKGRRVSAEVRAFVRWLETVMDVRHTVEIHVCKRLRAFFDAPGKYTGFHPYMVVSLDDAEILTTIAHELVHYEQWRDKRDENERGVEQRAAALVRRWKREAA